MTKFDAIADAVRVAQSGPPPDPTPLPTAPAAAPFPVDALPAWARRWVEAESVATQTPLDLAGCCVLGVLAACAGGRAVVLVRPGWREPTNAYLLPVLPPASRKTAVISASTAPLYAVEEELAVRVTASRGEALITRDIAMKAAQKAAQAAANAADEDKRRKLTADAVSAQSAAEAIEVPTLPRLIADDVTPEAVGSLLAEHGGRLAIISAEGGIFDVMGGRYSNNVPSLDVWLKGHAGDPLRVDRKSRAAEYVKSPALSLLLTIQPSVLSALARNGAFRGRGLTARFLYSLPADNVGRRKVGAPTMPDAVADAYDFHVRRLAADLAEWVDPVVLQLSADAHNLVLGLEAAVEPRLLPDGEYGAIRDWAGKLVGAVVRLAGLLHLADGDAGAFRQSISRDTVERAIRLGDYYASHAARAFSLLGDGGTSNAEYVLRFLRRKSLKGFTIRSLHVDLPRGRFATAEDVTAAVEVLVEHGWVIPLPAPPRSGPGRAPSPGFEVHPSLLGEEDPLDPVKVSTESTVPTESPSLLDIARAIALVEFPSTESTDPQNPDPGGQSVDSVESVDTSSGSSWGAGPGSVDSVENVDTSDDRTCRRCGRTSMHPLNADALCVERCAKPPAPQMPAAPDRTCTRCRRASAHPLLLGRCRRRSYPDDPDQVGRRRMTRPDARSPRRATTTTTKENTAMTTTAIAADARYLVVAALCDCGGVAVSVLDGCYDPSNLTPDPDEVLLVGPDWRPLVTRAAGELQKSTGAKVLARCTVAMVPSRLPDHREREFELTTAVTDLLYAEFPNGRPAQRSR
jgi:hypothetical protein